MLKLWDIKPSPTHKGPKDLKLLRVHELGRVARDRDGACDAILNAVARAFLYVETKDFGNPDRLPGKLARWAYRYAPSATKGRLAAAVDAATDYPHWQGAKACARAIGLRETDRLRLKITTIDACDATKQQLAQSARQRKRDRDKTRAKAKRREVGRPTREQIAAQAAQRRLAVAESGVSQATFYRRRKAGENAASPLLLRENQASPFRPAADDNDTSPHFLTFLERRRTTRCVENVAGGAGATGYGSPVAHTRQSEPLALASQGKSGADAERGPDPGAQKAKGASAKRLTAIECEKNGQLNWLEPTRALSLGQPDHAARAGAGRAEAAVPPRAAAASKLSPETFRRMAKLQQWGISADRVTAWHQHISDSVLEELFAGAVHRNRGATDAREWLEEQVECALSNPHYRLPTHPDRRRGQGLPAKLVLATYDSSGANVLTRGGIAKLLEEMGEPMSKDQLGPLLCIMVFEGSLIRMSRGRYRRASAEQRSPAPSSKRETAVP